MKTTGRWAPHEVAVIAMGFVLPLGGDSSGPSWLGDPNVRIALIGAAMVALALNELGQRQKFPLRPAVRATVLPLVLYGGLLGIDSLSWRLPADRMMLYGAYIVATGAAYILCERSRPGSFLDVAYRVGVLHVAFMTIYGERETLFEGTERLTGALSAVSLGFEATMVLAIAASQLRARRGRLVPLVIAGISVYIIYATFSRAALISLALGAALAFICGRRIKPLRLIALAVALIVGYYTLADRILLALGGQQQYGFASLTGRTTIWQRVIDHNEHWFRGYGFAALRFKDGLGPDAILRRWTGGLPAENALLFAVLMAGLLAGALWLWLAGRIAWSLWTARTPLAWFTLTILAVNAFLSAGLGGNPPTFWWLLGAASLVASYQLGDRVVDRNEPEAVPPGVEDFHLADHSAGRRRRGRFP
jgi:hypothetical protein